MCSRVSPHFPFLSKYYKKVENFGKIGNHYKWNFFNLQNPKMSFEKSTEEKVGTETWSSIRGGEEEAPRLTLED